MGLTEVFDPTVQEVVPKMIDCTITVFKQAMGCWDVFFVVGMSLRWPIPVAYYITYTMTICRPVICDMLILSWFLLGLITGF